MLHLRGFDIFQADGFYRLMAFLSPNAQDYRDEGLARFVPSRSEEKARIVTGPRLR
jgi:hypothetical protein